MSVEPGNRSLRQSFERLLPLYSLIRAQGRRYLVFSLWAVLCALFALCISLPGPLYYLATAGPASVRWRLWILFIPLGQNTERWGAYSAGGVWLGPGAIEWSASHAAYPAVGPGPELPAWASIVRTACAAGGLWIPILGLALLGLSVASTLEKHQKAPWLFWIALAWPATISTLNAIAGNLGRSLN